MGGQISSESCITGRARSKNHDSRMSAHFRHKERGAAFGVGLSQFQPTLASRGSLINEMTRMGLACLCVDEEKTHK